MRILLFYVLAIFVIVAVIPWREITGEQSPFVQIFSSLGIGWAAALLNVVVLSAALSAINSDLYGAGRVIHGMARQKLAPKMFAKIDPRNGVPVSTISALLIVLVIGVVLQLINPTAERLFQDIAALATFATIFVWLMILISHLAYRKHLNSEDVAHANFTVPLWPLGQYFAIAMILLTFGTMFWMSDFHSALIAGVVFTVAMSIRYYFIDRKNKAEAAAA